MTNGLAAYTYDSEGRLVAVQFPDGASAQYNYDTMGNRTSVVDTGPGSTPSCCPPTVAAFPKKQNGDFKNNAMMVMLSNGELAGWGDCTTGALANGIMASVNAPAQGVLFDPNTAMPPFDATIVDWAFTNANLYVVYSNGWVYSAGSNDYGQLGHGDTLNRPYLKRLDYFPQNYLSVTRVWACGAYSTTHGGGCVYFQASDYSMYGCGENVAGNLGNYSGNQSTPVPCTNIPFSAQGYVIDVEIACCGTSFSTYMLFNDGAVMVAGYNGQGQLAQNNTSNVTSGFTYALEPPAPPLMYPHPVGGVTMIAANGGYDTAPAGNALLYAEASYPNYSGVLTAGFNSHGELGQGNTAGSLLFQGTTSDPLNFSTGAVGGGYVGYGYYLDTDGMLSTWGYNGQNNLFQNNATTPQTNPVQVTILPATVSKVHFPKGNNLATNAQLIVLTSTGTLLYAGVDNGQLGVPSAQYPNAITLLPTPLSLLDAAETISDIFVHGSGTAQRWFVLTSLGNLYSCGNNAGSICTGGVSSDVKPANAEWQKISFL